MILPEGVLDKFESLRVGASNGHLGTAVTFRYEGLRDWILSLIAEQEEAKKLILSINAEHAKTVLALNDAVLQNGELKQALWLMWRNPDDTSVQEATLKLLESLDAVKREVPVPKCICPNGTRTAIAHVSDCPMRG